MTQLVLAAATGLHHPFAQYAADHSVVPEALGLASLGAMAFVLWSITLSEPPACQMGLRNPAAPRGIVSFELARTKDLADRVVDSWSGANRVKARRSLHKDFGLIVVYSTLLAFLAAFAAAQWHARGHPLVASTLVVLAWLAWVAGLLDVAENLFLLQILRIRTAGQELRDDRLSASAAGCASLKFLLIVVITLAAAPALFLRTTF